MELILPQNQVKEVEQQTLESICRDLIKKVKSVEIQLTNRIQVDLDKLKQELDDIQEQLKIVENKSNVYKY